jgi:chromosome segregation protein
LLADTGLGRNAYAIVGQGKVDEVLNQRPEERRYVLEESVGIGRYRWRKRESTQKLAGAERDLERLNDIIAELTLRIDEISPEADRASEYLDIWRALRNLEKEQAQAELIRTRKLLAGITNEIKGNEKRLDELKSKLLKAQDRAEKTKEALAGLEEQQREVLLREGTLKTQLASLEGSLNALGLRSDVRNEIEDREVKTARLKASHERFTEALKVQEEELERLLDEAEKVRALRDESRSALLAVNSELKTKRTDLKDAKTRVVDLLNEKSEIEKNITLASARKESVNRDLQRLRDRRVAATLRLDEAQSRLAQTKETWRGLQERENELRKILEQSEFAVRSQRADLQDLTVSREKERASILALKAKIETLQEMALRQVGFGSGTRAILYGIKNGDLDGSKIFGPLGDLIETSRDYRLALIAGIGGAMDYLVLEDERTARLCIEYLKKRKAGRATFLPLDMVRPSSVSSRELAILDQEGAVGTLVSLITFDSRIEPAVSHIMGRVVVAENLDRAVRLWKRLGFSLRVVTLGGEVVRPGGSMTGGYLAQREKDGSVTGPIGRKAEIEALKKQVGEKEAAFNTLSEQVSAKNTEIENTNRVLEENRSSLKEVSENVLRCKIEIDNSETEIRSIMDELETLEGEEKYIFLSSESEADTGQGPGVEEIKAEIEVIGDKIASLEKETSSLEETAANLQGRLEHLSGEVGRLEEGGASRRQSVLETRTRLEEIDREITDNGEILKRLLDEERKLKENRLQSEEKIRQITARLEEMQVKSSGMKEEEKRLRGDLASAERECHRLLQQVESCLALLGEKRSAALITEAEVASWRSTLERLISEQGPGVLGSEISAACLDLDIDSSIAGSITSFQDQNPEVFLSRIDELRRRLSSIGPVNLPLIEE